jgi:hypothetical protein
LSGELYRAYAQECLHFASGMETPAPKAALLNMAYAWLRLAKQAEMNAAYQPNGLKGDAGPKRTRCRAIARSEAEFCPEHVNPTSDS